VVTHKGGDLSELRDRLEGRTSVLLGHSGVGKSTLVNALVPDADREIGHVNAVTGRGRHTSTSAIMLPLPAGLRGDGGWIIDTPGIRSCGLDEAVERGDADPVRVESFRRLLAARSLPVY
jgi:ribosome biogenesis GTPase